MGRLHVSQQLTTNSLDNADEAKQAGQGVSDYPTNTLHTGDVSLDSEDLDNPVNFPRNLFIWRANLLGCSAKGMEYVMKHLLGAQNNLLGENLEEMGLPLPKFEKWHKEDVTGKLDLVVTVDYRMTTSSLHSDIVLPAASWYEKNDISSTDMHPFIHPFSKAIDPVWESRNDWQFFKDLAKQFSEL